MAMAMRMLLSKRGSGWGLSLLAWLPVATVALLALLMLNHVRLNLIPQLQVQAERDLQRRADVMATRIAIQIDNRWRELQIAARAATFTRKDASPQALQQELDWLRARQPVFLWVAFVTPDGQLVSSGQADALESTSFVGPAARAAWQDGQFIGDVAPPQVPTQATSRAQAQRSAVLTLATPVADDQGRRVGALIALLGTDWLANLRAHARSGPEAGPTIQAQVLVGEPPRPIFAARAEAQTDGPEQRETAASDEVPRGEASRPLLSALQPVPAPQVAAASPWSWQVLLTRDMDDALSTAHELMATIAAFSLLATAVLGLSGHWLARRVLDPWRYLIEAAQRQESLGRLGGLADSLHDVLRDSPTAAPAEGRSAGPRALLAKLAADARHVQRVLDHLPVGVVLSGPKLEIEHVNQTLSRRLGWSTESVRHQLDGAFLCFPSDRKLIEAQLQDLIAEPAEFTARLQARQADGTPLAVQWHFVPLRDEQGRLEGGISVVMDIDAETTARRRADALDQRLRLLLEVAVDQALILLDEDGRVLSWNVGAERVFGWSQEQAQGLGLNMLFETDARSLDLPRQLLEQAAQCGRSDIDTALQHASGRRLHGLGSLYAMPAKAWPVAFALNVRDVSAQQNAAQRLAESEARLAAVIDSASDAIVSIDELGLVRLFNPGAERIFGRSASEVLGAPLDQLLPGAVRQQHSISVKAFKQSGDSTRRMGTGQVWGQRADGTRLALESSISQAVIGGRTVMTAILRDVTARLEAEAALRRYQAELADLSQRLLAQEKETTRRLAQTLHDELGQTITAMRLNFDACRAVFPTDGVYAQRIERLQKLIGTGYAQVRQALVELRPPLLDDQGLVPALENEVAVRQGAHPDVEIHFHVAAAVAQQRWPSTVEYAAYMIAREALQNALVHSGARRIRLQMEGGPARLQLSLIDDGSGIPASLKSKPGHLGLVGMRERALAIGAQLSVGPGVEGGTAVQLDWQTKTEELLT